MLKFEGEYFYNKILNSRGYDENCNIIYKLITGINRRKKI